MKILIIVTSTGTFANGKLATGLWLSEFTHIYHSAKESGYDITVANPKGILKEVILPLIPKV